MSMGEALAYAPEPEPRSPPGARHGRLGLRAVHAVALLLAFAAGWLVAANRPRPGRFVNVGSDGTLTLDTAHGSSYFLDKRRIVGFNVVTGRRWTTPILAAKPWQLAAVAEAKAVQHWLGVAFLLGLVATVYAVPALLAFYWRRKRRWRWIALLGLAAGSAVVPWVVALLWAIRAETPPQA